MSPRWSLYDKIDVPHTMGDWLSILLIYDTKLGRPHRSGEKVTAIYKQKYAEFSNFPLYKGTSILS